MSCNLSHHNPPPIRGLFHPLHLFRLAPLGKDYDEGHIRDHYGCSAKLCIEPADGICCFLPGISVVGLVGLVTYKADPHALHPASSETS